MLRLILADDDRQVAVIRALMEREPLFVPLTVLLEAGWVLESRYRLPRDEVAQALSNLIALDRVEIARRKLVLWAVSRYCEGADWADMVHVVAAAKLTGFATLDRDLRRRAAESAPVAIETLT